MTPVQGWNGQDVHKGQDNGDQRSSAPKGLPVPSIWKESADGSNDGLPKRTLAIEKVKVR